MECESLSYNQNITDITIHGLWNVGTNDLDEIKRVFFDENNKYHNLRHIRWKEIYQETLSMTDDDLTDPEEMKVYLESRVV